MFNFSLTRHEAEYSVLLIAILCIISRLPQLLSPELFIDGDEAIVGLMAKHFYEGAETPLFFYGQSYGFSFLEVLTVSLFYAVAGVSDIAIKCAGLLLWSTGIVFFYKALKQLDFKQYPLIPLLVTMLFIFASSWAVWSMKIRGGYLTAFLLSSIVMYLIFKNKSKSSILDFLISGFFIIVIYQSQPLWLPGLLPLVIFRLFKTGPVKRLLSFSAGLLIGMSGFYFIKKNLSDFWSPQVFDLSALNVKTITSIPEQVFANLTGSYAYTTYIEPGIITEIWSVCFLLLIISAILYGLFLIIVKRKRDRLLGISILSVLVTVTLGAVTIGENPRYYLPLTGFSLFMISVLMHHIKYHRKIGVVFGVFISIGAVSLYHFKDYKYESKSHTIELIDELKSENIRFVFCEGGLLQWQIMFYSREHIIARFFSNTDRYPEYITKVNSALEQNDPRVGLVGYYNENDSLSSVPGFKSVNDVFFILKNPPAELLEERGFDLGINH